MKRVTMNDVAVRAGVSISTVSHVINQTRIVEEPTKQKVLESIQALKYRPSIIAKSLASQHTSSAGLLISDVGNPFYDEVIMGVEDVALANGYSIFLCNTVYDLNRGMKYIHSLIDRSVDGIIFMSSNMNFAMVNEVHANSIQSVVMDWGGTDVKKIASTITIDFNTGFQEAVRHLVELGHERIAFASGPRRLWTIRIRKQAFLDAIAGCPTTPEAIFLPEEKISAEGGRVGIEGGYMAFKALSRLKSRPSAVIATNDQIALGIIWAARDAGFKLPEDLSIIGLDDIDLASRVTPTLTTIALPRYEIGKLAMNSLLNLISNPSQLNNNQIVTTSLIVRGSTTRAPGK